MKTSSSVGDALELARALRRDGFVATQVQVGDVSITLEPIVAPVPSTRARGKADAQGVVDEYGGAAVAKLLGDAEDAGDDEYAPAIKA